MRFITFELSAYNPFRWQTQAISIKGRRFL